MDFHKEEVDKIDADHLYIQDKCSLLGQKEQHLLVGVNLCKPYNYAVGLASVAEEAKMHLMLVEIIMDKGNSKVIQL